MRVAQIKHYNKNNIKVSIVDCKKPDIGERDLLIKVSAAGVNPLDNMISRGEVKIIVPYKLPIIAGNEMVGTVVEKGSMVSKFNVGDRVFARLPLNNIGAFAEYVSVPEDALAIVPSYLSDIEAAAIPLTALTVMQALDLMKVESGRTIFISGATGGVGAMAIPIAKAKGLKVISNGSAENAQRVLALGSDQFIDYKTQDYTELLSDIDYVLDTLGDVETKKQMTIMKKGADMVSLKAMPNRAFAKRMGLAGWKEIVFALVGRQYDKLAEKYGITYNFIFVESNGRQLQEAAAILENLKIKPSIDTVYNFADINVALDKVDNGHSKGKTVITMI